MENLHVEGLNWRRSVRAERQEGSTLFVEASCCFAVGYDGGVSSVERFHAEQVTQDTFASEVCGHMWLRRLQHDRVRHTCFQTVGW